GSIYFEYIEDYQAADERFRRARDREPEKLSYLANYAEFLLAARRDDEAKVAAASALNHDEAQQKGYAEIRLAMSFVMFGAEFCSGNLRNALGELDEIDRHSKVAAAEFKELASEEAKRSYNGWSYKGIRRSLERRLGAGSIREREVRKVLTFVET